MPISLLQYIIFAIFQKVTISFSANLRQYLKIHVSAALDKKNLTHRIHKPGHMSMKTWK